MYYNYKKIGLYITKNLTTIWLDSKVVIESNIVVARDYFLNLVARYINGIVNKYACQLLENYLW